jgi:hypothetical protein
VVRRCLLDRYMCICDCVVHVRSCSFAVIFHHPASVFLDVCCLCLCFRVRGGCGCLILREHLGVGCG